MLEPYGWKFERLNLCLRSNKLCLSFLEDIACTCDEISQKFLRRPMKCIDLNKQTSLQTWESNHLLCGQSHIGKQRLECGYIRIRRRQVSKWLCAGGHQPIPASSGYFPSNLSSGHLHQFRLPTTDYNFQLPINRTSNPQNLTLIQSN